MSGPGQTLEINLTDLDFCLLSTDSRRTAVVTEIPENAGGGRMAKNPAPQILALKNVLPTTDGYCSLDKKRFITPEVTVPSPFEHVFTLTASDGLDYQIAKLESGLGISRVGFGDWTYFTITGLVAPFTLSYAQIDGETYFFFSYIGCYRFNPNTFGLEPIDLTGLDSQQILGITQASNYFIAYSTNKIFWDSQTNRLDFTPELGNGGSEQLSTLHGNIIIALPLANGFIVYSSTNAVSAQYSGNPNFPFVFKEIPNSAGIRNQYEVAWRTNLDSHIVWTKSGLQQVNSQNANLGIPLLSEFLNKGVLEVFTSNGFIRENIEKVFRVKLELIGHRYLGISYGKENLQFEHALIYDIELKRYGKLEITHVSLYNLILDERAHYLSYQDLYEHGNPTYLAYTEPDQTYLSLSEVTELEPRLLAHIASVTEAGVVDYYKRVNLEDEDAAGTLRGHIIVSPITYIKNRPITLYEIEVQNVLQYFGEDPPHDQFVVFSGNDYDLFLSPATRTIPMSVARSERVRRYLIKKCARYFGFYLEGRFELTNLMFKIKPTGNNKVPYAEAIGGGSIGGGSVPFSEVSFETLSYVVGEPELLTVFVQRIGDLSLPCSVNYNTSDITAEDGLDYTGVSGTLNWAAGDGDEKSFTVDILDDILSEPTETFALHLTNPVNCDLGDDLATVSIETSPGHVQFSATAYYGSELTGTVLITVLRLGGVSGPASISYYCSPNTATTPADYTDTSGTLNWADGDGDSKTFSVPIIGDAIDEEIEDFAVHLITPVGATLGSPSDAIVYIAPDQVINVRLFKYSSPMYAASNGAECVLATVDSLAFTTNGLEWDYGKVGNLSADLQQNDSINGLEFINNRYIAIARDFLYESTDKLSWIRRTAHATFFGIKAVAFGAGLYATFHTSGEIYTSPDMIVWTLRASGSLVTFNGARWLNGQFVAYGNGGILITSPDGITWTVQTTGIGDSITGVAYGGGKYIAVGTFGNIIVSNDAITWTVDNAAGFTYSDVIYAHGIFIAAHNLGIRTRVSAGVWADRIRNDFTTNDPAVTCFKLASTGALTICGTNASNQGYLYYSTDGIGWARRTRLSQLDCQSLAKGADGQYILVGSGTSGLNASMSVDRYEWCDKVTQGGVDFKDICYGGGYFVAVGPANAVVYAASAFDDLTYAATGPSAGANGICYSPDLGLYVAVSSNGNIFTSSNRTSWTLRTSGIATNLNRVAAADWHVIAVGSVGRILWSTDGITWHIVSLVGAGSTTFRDICFSPELQLWVAAGEDGKIFTSPDGEIFTQIATATGPIVCMQWGLGTFFGIVDASPAKAIRSLDGIVWTYAYTRLKSETITKLIFDGEIFMFCGGSKLLGVTPSATRTHKLPEVEFTAYSPVVNEGNGDHLVVKRTNSSVGICKVDYDSYFDISGVGGDGTSYVAAAGTVTWADGDMADKTISVTSLANVSSPPNPHISGGLMYLRLRNPVNCSIGQKFRQYMTVVDIG